MSTPAEHDTPLTIAGRTFRSRLFVGTGKYASLEQTRDALRASGAEVVTVAVRRVNMGETGQGSLLGMLRAEGFALLPNTAGCYTADDAIRTARLGREAGGTDLVKLEVIGDPKTLFPDTEALVVAARVLVKEGFVVLPYTNDDPIVARKLVDAGCPAVMPLGAPIGSGLGIRNPYNLRILMETVSVPVIVDAGVGTASDAALAMELGCDGVLMNTAIAAAKDPVRMATAMKLGIDAGRLAFLAGRMERKLYANASSPLEGTIASGGSGGAGVVRGRDALGLEVEIPVVRSMLVLPFLAALASAPIQCPRETTVETAREETPGEALWTLAERFRAGGNAPARTQTLRFLIERYPSSRFAEAARHALEEPGGAQAPAP